MCTKDPYYHAIKMLTSLGLKMLKSCIILLLMFMETFFSRTKNSSANVLHCSVNYQIKLSLLSREEGTTYLKPITMYGTPARNDWICNNNPPNQNWPLWKWWFLAKLEKATNILIASQSHTTNSSTSKLLRPF